MKKNDTLSQVFNFVSLLKEINGKLHVFSSTQEGLLWSLKIEDDKFKDIASQQVTDSSAAPTLSSNQDSDTLLVVSHEIQLYKVEE